MARYVVNVPDTVLRGRYTAGQFLAEFAECHGRSKARDLKHPVRIGWVNVSEQPQQQVCRTAGQIFRVFDLVAAAKGAIYLLSWSSHKLGAAGLYELNRAIRESAIRKGGLNIVHHWLETRRGCMTPLGSDLAALFDYLEIRPLFRARIPVQPPSLTPSTAPLPESNAIHYVYNTNRHKGKDLGDGKRRSYAKSKK